MEGNFQVGFFDMTNDGDPQSSNWFKLSYYKFMHDTKQAHCKLSIIGDYCMYYKKRSDIAYLCTEYIMGYSINCQEWKEIEKECLTELC